MNARFVVLPAEILERVRIAMLHERERTNMVTTYFNAAGEHPKRASRLAAIDADIAAIDAALSAPEPFERETDEDNTPYIDAGVMRLWRWDTGTVLMMCNGGSDIEIPAHSLRAVALALLALTEEAP